MHDDHARLADLAHHVEAAALAAERAGDVCDAAAAYATTHWPIPRQLLVAAALVAGPATRAEVAAAVRRADQRITDHTVLTALQELEVDGRVASLRTSPRACVLWTLTGRRLPQAKPSDGA